MNKENIDWEERKYELTKVFTQTLLRREKKDNNYLGYAYGRREEIVATAIMFADEVVKQLK